MAHPARWRRSVLPPAQLFLGKFEIGSRAERRWRYRRQGREHDADTRRAGLLPSARRTPHPNACATKAVRRWRQFEVPDARHPRRPADDGGKPEAPALASALPSSVGASTETRCATSPVCANRARVIHAQRKKRRDRGKG